VSIGGAVVEGKLWGYSRSLTRNENGNFM